MTICGAGNSVPSGPAITSVTVTPNPATAIIGTQVQFAAQVSGTGSYSSGVTWSLLAPSGSTLSPGTLSSTGLYITPYPAPATVTVTATSTQDPSQSDSVTVALEPPPTEAGPALTVDAGQRTHPINPYIYGMNDWFLALTPSIEQAANLPVERWGGDQTTRYNYLLDAYSSAADWYFENSPGSTSGYPDTSILNTQIAMDESAGTKTMVTVPLIGWTTQRSTACSFSVAKYGAQRGSDPNRPDCGNGILLNGSRVVNDPNDTSSPIDQTFDAGWVQFLVDRFGNAASGGVAIYELDNEPEWWDSTQVDVHPLPNTYDELTNDGLTYAQTVKDNDPTAEVSGPVLSCWICFFYSKLDIESGWATSPCNCANGNPVDRLAHGDVPLVEYYLQHFAAYEALNGVRLLDYLDLHFYNPDNLAFSPAGDTSVQQSRLNSTRVFWDSTYTDPNYTDPNNRTSSAPPVSPQLIPLARSWVAKDYPGTKVAFTEYNWGGTDSINGALAQADLLGIFGSYGLDMATLWWNTYDAQTAVQEQLPVLMAFEVYRNYDGKNSMFGDIALASTSANQGMLSVYGALRSLDNAVTVVVINKTYGDLTSTISFANLRPKGPAKVFLYSNANLAAIVPQPDLAITPPASRSTTSTLAATFPAQSITVLAVPAALSARRRAPLLRLPELDREGGGPNRRDGNDTPTANIWDLP
jgi:hypothetical protein